LVEELRSETGKLAELRKLLWIGRGTLHLRTQELRSERLRSKLQRRGRNRWADKMTSSEWPAGGRSPMRRGSPMGRAPHGSRARYGSRSPFVRSAAYIRRPIIDRVSRILLRLV